MRKTRFGRTRHIEAPPIAAINRLAEKLSAEGASIINLGQAILGLPPPLLALAAVRDYLKPGKVHAYSPDPGQKEVLQVVAQFISQMKAIPTTPAEIVLTCGANQAFVNALLTATDPGDEVIVFTPHYFDHVFAIELASCKAVFVPMLQNKEGFKLDRRRLEAAISTKTRVISLVAPANPAGYLFEPNDLLWICQLAERLDLPLFSDETYDLITYQAPFVSPASLSTKAQIVTLGSFSKTLGLAAWRIGYLRADADFIRESIKVQDALVVCAPVPSQLAIAAALPHVQSYIDDALVELNMRRDLLLYELSHSDYFEAIPPQGGTFCLVKCRDTRSSLDIAKALLNEVGIISIPGSAFGPEGEGMLRISFGNQPRDILQDACRRLRSFAGEAA